MNASPSHEQPAEQPSDRSGARTGPRVTALDGLRGIAATIVFIEHFMLTIPVFSDVFMQSASTANPANLTPASLAWWLSYTPLHIIWQGTGAVYIFFILSGYVLTLPSVRMLARTPGTIPEQVVTTRLSGYYIRRILRLYLPVWGAILLALAAFTLVPRHPAPASNMSSWLLQRSAASTTLEPLDIAQDATLIFGAGETVSPLWTLQWEVWFSLLLPLFALIALRFRHRSATLILIALALVTLGAFSGVSEALYLPMFLLGATLATAHGRISTLASRLTPFMRLTLLVAALILITSRWVLLGFAFTPHSFQFTVTTTLLGALIIVFLALHSPLISRMLSSRPLVTLGRFSFSLYLVHEPILVSFAFLFKGDHLLVFIITSLTVAVVTVLFYYLIERPSQHLGRFLARRFAS